MKVKACLIVTLLITLCILVGSETGYTFTQINTVRVENKADKWRTVLVTSHCKEKRQQSVREFSVEPRGSESTYFGSRCLDYGGIASVFVQTQDSSNNLFCYKSVQVSEYHSDSKCIIHFQKESDLRITTW